MIRVLVVDDDPMQLELLDRALSREGFELRAVSSVETLEVEAREFEPQLMLIDVNLPDTDPAKVIEAARRGSRAHLVLYSAWEDSKLRGLAKQFGADGYICKSESVFALGQRLRDMNRGNDVTK